MNEDMKRMRQMIRDAMAQSLAPKTPDVVDSVDSIEAHINARLTQGTVKLYRAMVDMIEPNSVTFFLTCHGTARNLTNVPMRVDLPRDGRSIPDHTLAEYFARELAYELNVAWS